MKNVILKFAPAVLVFCLTLFVVTQSAAWVSKKAKEDAVEVRQEQKVSSKKTTSVAKKSKKRSVKSVRSAAKKSKEKVSSSAEEEVEPSEDVAEEEKEGIDLENLEGEMIESMLQGDGFPEKSEFIATQDQSKTKPARLDDSPQSLVKKSDEPAYGQLIYSTLAIVAVIFALAFLWRFLQSKPMGLFPSQNGKLKILAQQMIGARSKVIILEALGKRYLVGATQENIQLLADLDFFEAAEQDLIGPEKQLSQETLAESLSEEEPGFTEISSPMGASLNSSVADKVKQKLKDLKKISSLK